MLIFEMKHAWNSKLFGKLHFELVGLKPLANQATELIKPREHRSILGFKTGLFKLLPILLPLRLAGFVIWLVKWLSIWQSIDWGCAGLSVQTRGLDTGLMLVDIASEEAILNDWVIFREHVIVIVKVLLNWCIICWNAPRIEWSAKGARRSRIRRTCRENWPVCMMTVTKFIEHVREQITLLCKLIS